MRQPETNEPRWLSLSEAAERLDVHPTTLRRWADEGHIPVMLTPGGHRRFADSDLEHMSERRHSIRGIGPVERIWASQALERTRNRIMEQEKTRWMERHDEDARVDHRHLGRLLLQLTLEYLTAAEEDETRLEEARKIGRQYGDNARALGMPVTEALAASMFFRDTLVSTAVELPENVRIPPGSQARLLERINRVLNDVQLGIAEAYDRG